MKRAIVGAVLLGSVLSSPPAAQAAPARTAAAETWRTVSLPFLWPSRQIEDVDAAAADAVWISGIQGQYCIVFFDGCLASSNGNPVVRRWNGWSWQEYPVNGWTGNGDIANVEAGGGEVWIENGLFGSDPYLGRFTGSAFAEVTPPPVSWFDLLDAGPAGVWVTGGDATRHPLYRWNGGGWTATPLPARLGVVEGIASTGPRDAWAIGRQSSHDEGARVAEFAHWNGSAWQELPAAPTSWPPDRIAASGPSGVWVSAGRQLAHWDGSAWTVVATPDQRSARNLAVGSDGAPVAVVTTGLAEGPVWTLARYASGSWQPLSPPSTVSPLTITAVPGTTRVWAAGRGSGNDWTTPYVITNG